jgi:D-alanyl-D-alanine endopeptidase (penicillin-binding protein 7)
MPIASLTKLMAAMVALDHGIPWNNSSTISPDDDVVGGNLTLFRGETVTMRDLFNASLLGSANNATLAYVRSLGMTDEEFVEAMNRKAVVIGLEQTQFVGITGLDKNNVSTAYEVAKMAHYAFTNYPEIAKATSQKEYTFIIQGSNREHTIHNTNKLISEHDKQFTGSKTGFLYEAGYCLVVEEAGAKKNIMAVVLNSPSEEAHFADIDSLVSLPTP